MKNQSSSQVASPLAEEYTQESFIQTLNAIMITHVILKLSLNNSWNKAQMYLTDNKKHDYFNKILVVQGIYSIWL